MDEANQQPNRLVKEKSPYLLQHAYNPVDWHPWGEEAFTKAKTEDKPIFLSIGYATCHWCHVMERESFEDRQVADLLNRHFVAIKVDREERPDIDQLYMTVCQAMTGRGGWPLTVLLTAEKKPFFAGTYFPKTTWGQNTGLMDILKYFIRLWREDRQKVLASGEQITAALREMAASAQSGPLDEGTLSRGYQELTQRFDGEWGGFGPAPKFPTPHLLSFLIRYGRRQPGSSALAMAEKTLTAIFQGGIHDHIGGGYARYSTDRQWLVPHFEKMLYDNALLAMAYLEAYQATGKAGYAQAAGDILDYALREMTSDEGGFYSAEDADSEGEEGKYYLWSLGEVTAAIGPERAAAFAPLFHITPAGNFEGQSIPNLIGVENCWQTALMFHAERDQLRRLRDKRIHPLKDDKVLTGWNGLMIAAMAMAGRILQAPRYAEAARKAADFILSRLRRPDGRLLLRYREGEAAVPAFLEDYAYLIWGLLELYQARFRASDLAKALTLGRDLLRLFWDEGSGGCFISGSDGEQLLSRSKEIYDGALPSGNAVAALVFLRLEGISGDAFWRERAQKIFQAFGGTVASHPSAHCQLLIALQGALDGRQKVVISGEDAAAARGFLEAARQDLFLPDTDFILADGDLRRLLPHLAAYASQPGRVTAYLCRDFTCLSPVADPEELRLLLSGK